jgi:hypothetical protein
LKSSGGQEGKIAVWIFGFEPFPREVIEPILWGLEEEGIPADFRQAPDDGAVSLAKLAADGSPLNVGIGISGAKKAVALHHRDLPPGKPLFSLAEADLKPDRLRRLGANAARLVKGEPLALQDEYTFTSESKPATQIRKNEVLDKIAALVLANIRGDINEG